MPSTASSQRSLGLDVLRGVAILMVLVCHGALLRSPTWDMIIWRPCWSGVDLFFVISGFLISGLLFSEYKRTDRIRFRRFAVRRAMKIYPAFFTMVALTVVIRVTQHRYEVWPQLLHDVFFVQSYLPGTWGHFWSLSVEEHFYILLPVLMFTMMRFASQTSGNPFTAIPKLFILVALAVLAARIATAKYMPYSLQTNHFPTHLRVDSLFFGVVLSYYYHFHNERFVTFVKARRAYILAAAALLLTPLLLVGQWEPWMYTWGFTFVYLGYGCLLVASLHVSSAECPRPALTALRVVAYVGTFSYSIYLWHAFCSGILSRLPARFSAVRVVIFFASSILVGVVASKLIEFPVIRIRDRLFPSTGRLLVGSPAGEARRIELMESASASPVNSSV
jgi:peptidoglycan/LPS O-acetylase OafA/YrhL